MRENRKLLNQKRKKYILDFIDRDGGVTTVELADKLAVSLSTIRRDLNNLEKNGLVLKTHGGAVPRSFSTSYEPPYHLKSHLQKREKELIGKLASSFIKEGDTVIFDSGTTIFQIAHYSKEKQFSAIALDLAIRAKPYTNAVSPDVGDGVIRYDDVGRVISRHSTFDAIIDSIVRDSDIA